MLDIMGLDEITMQTFKDQANLEAVSANGAYRKIIAKPEDVDFNIVEMQNQNEDLLEANYLTEADPTPVIEPLSTTPITKALRIRFNLRPSSYATMFLREVTRTSSAFSTQQQISAAAKDADHKE